MIATLLEVPRYADLIDNDVSPNDNDLPATESVPVPPPNVLVNSSRAWRSELAKWVGQGTEDEDALVLPARFRSKWLPMPLAKLFGDAPIAPNGPRPRRQQFTQESLLMELLAAGYEDEEPDDGALSGSGDEYEE